VRCPVPCIANRLGNRSQGTQLSEHVSGARDDGHPASAVHPALSRPVESGRPRVAGTGNPKDKANLQARTKKKAQRKKPKNQTPEPLRSRKPFPRRPIQRRAMPEQHKSPGQGLCDLGFFRSAFGIRTRDLHITSAGPTKRSNACTDTNDPTPAGASRTIGHFAGSPRQEVSEKSPTRLKTSLPMTNLQVKRVINSRPHVREVQGDGAGRARGEHHRVLRNSRRGAAPVTVTWAAP